jgi:hypothetical protein
VFLFSLSVMGEERSSVIEGRWIVGFGSSWIGSRVGIETGVFRINRACLYT